MDLILKPTPGGYNSATSHHSPEGIQWLSRRQTSSPKLGLPAVVLKATGVEDKENRHK